jgi:hypothetical protein
MKGARKVIWFSLIILLALAFGTVGLAQANLLVNPGFEANGGSYDGWTVYATGAHISTPDNDDIYRSGTAAAKIYGEFTNCPDFPQFDDGVVFQTLPATPGLEYEFSGYTFVSNADTIPGSNTCDYNRLLAKIAFFNGSGIEVSGNEIVIGDWSTPLDQWLEFSVTAPAPPTAATMQALLIFLQPACDEGSVFVDDLSLVGATPTTEPNMLVNPSFNTDLSGWTTFGNVYYDGRTWARRTPTGGAKLYGTFVEGSDSGMFQQFPADPGSIWKFDAYVMTTCIESPIQPGNGNIVLAELLFKDAMGVETGSADAIILDQTSPIGTWTKHTVMGTAPAGTDSVAAYILFVQPVPTEQGAAWVDDLSLYDIAMVGVPEEDLVGATLHQNVPNPFNPRTQIAFELPTRGDVEVVVYNLAGREVVTLYRGELPAGPHSVTWDGRTSDGSPAASGTYWYQLRTPDGQTSRSMVLLK